MVLTTKPSPSQRDCAPQQPGSALTRTGAGPASQAPPANQTPPKQPKQNLPHKSKQKRWKLFSILKTQKNYLTPSARVLASTMLVLLIVRRWWKGIAMHLAAVVSSTLPKQEGDLFRACSRRNSALAHHILSARAVKKKERIESRRKSREKNKMKKKTVNDVGVCFSLLVGLVFCISSSCSSRDKVQESNDDPYCIVSDEGGLKSILLVYCCC